MSYKHLTINERTVIYEFYNQGKSIRYIAKALDLSPSTISRELKRNLCPLDYKYLQYQAQCKYESRRANSHRKIMINDEIKEYIESELKLTWSPEQISNRENKQLNIPSTTTIYRWIHKALLISKGI